MGLDSWSLLGRLRRAAKKIKFLLNYNVNRWKLASRFGASSSKRMLSFNDRSGLRAFVEYDQHAEAANNGGSGSVHGGGLRRTISSPISSDQDDIDKRAEQFIANFYRQLQIERQISLELKYARGHSFSSASP